MTEEDCKQRPPQPGRNVPGQSATPPPSPTALPHGNRFINASAAQLSLSRSPRGSYADENPFCAENIDVTNYLNLHSYTPHNDFCLAYVFTYRDFAGGTLGLAWVAEPSGSGGVCEKHRLMREGSNNVYKSLNTGVVTLLNYGSQVIFEVFIRRFSLFVSWVMIALCTSLCRIILHFAPVYIRIHFLVLCSKTLGPSSSIETL